MLKTHTKTKQKQTKLISQSQYLILIWWWWLCLKILGVMAETYWKDYLNWKGTLLAKCYSCLKNTLKQNIQREIKIFLLRDIHTFGSSNERKTFNNRKRWLWQIEHETRDCVQTFCQGVGFRSTLRPQLRAARRTSNCKQMPSSCTWGWTEKRRL